MKKLRMRHYASGPRKGYWLVSGGGWEMLVGPFGEPEVAWEYARGPIDWDDLRRRGEVVMAEGVTVRAMMLPGREVVDWRAAERDVWPEGLPVYVA